MGRVSRIFFISVPVVLSFVSGPSLLSQMQPASSFDKPINKKVVDFGPSPYSLGNVRVKLSCYSYPTFMVKEYDEGQKGAEWLAIAAVVNSVMPECTRSRAPGERVIEYPEWCGYFKGVKANLVFIDAADGTDGGIPFVVYDATTGKKIFEDSAYDSTIWTKKPPESPFNRIRVSVARDGQASLKYLRVVGTECDLHIEKDSCWEGVRMKLELKASQPPVCSGYKKIHDRWSSSIAYPVEVILFPQPVTKTIDGAIKCWPVD